MTAIVVSTGIITVLLYCLCYMPRPTSQKSKSRTIITSVYNKNPYIAPTSVDDGDQNKRIRQGQTGPRS